VRLRTDRYLARKRDDDEFRGLRADARHASKRGVVFTVHRNGNVMRAEFTEYPERALGPDTAYSAQQIEDRECVIIGESIEAEVILANDEDCA